MYCITENFVSSAYTCMYTPGISFTLEIMFLISKYLGRYYRQRAQEKCVLIQHIGSSALLVHICSAPPTAHLSLKQPVKWWFSSGSRPSSQWQYGRAHWIICAKLAQLVHNMGLPRKEGCLNLGIVNIKFACSNNTQCYWCDYCSMSHGACFQILVGIFILKYFKEEKN